MIKCLILQSTKPNGYGKFKLNDCYLAKITNNHYNTISILDNKGNWVPFKYMVHRCGFWNKIFPFYGEYFTSLGEFHVENKKEINKFIESIHNDNEYQTKIKKVIKNTRSLLWHWSGLYGYGKSKERIFYKFE